MECLHEECGHPYQQPRLTSTSTNSYFYSRKYHRRRVVNGVWVFGAVERERALHAASGSGQDSVHVAATHSVVVPPWHACHVRWLDGVPEHFTAERWRVFALCHRASAELSPRIGPWRRRKGRRMAKIKLSSNWMQMDIINKLYLVFWF